MSRDAFSYDPQDTRDTSPRRSARQQRSTRPDIRDGRNSVPEAPAGRESAEVREQHSTRDERSDSSRAYYVRDRAYLLHDSEMHSLKEIGKFRVIAASDLAKYAYGGDRERMEKDIRRLARQSLLTDKTIEISQKKTLLRKSHVPDDLTQFWLGHAGKSMTDEYSQIRDDVKYRKMVTEQTGIGFALPARTPSIAPNAPICTENRGVECLA